MGHYRIYTRTNPNQEIHNLLGILILLGMMTLLLGILLFDLSILTLGSGLVISGSLSSVWFLNETMRPSIDYSEEPSELAAAE